MALQKTITKTIPGFGGVVVCENAYWKVSELTGNKNLIKFCVCASSSGLQIDALTFSFVPSVDAGSGNFIAQAYNHIKTLPEFSGAVDC